MFSCISILLIFVIIVIIILLIGKFNKRTSLESFSNYKPIPNSEPVLNKEINTYLPVNYNFSDNFFFPNSEISNNDMNEILKKNISLNKSKYKNIRFIEAQEFKYDYYSGFTGDKINHSNILKYLKVIIDRINDTIIKDTKVSRTKNGEVSMTNSTQSTQLINEDYLYSLFLLIDIQIIKISTFEKLEKIEMLYDIYRFGKSSGFQIYCELILDKHNIIIIEMYVYGNINEDSLKISPFKNEENLDISKKFSYYYSNTDTKDKYLDNKELKLTSSIKEQINYLNKQLNKKENTLYDLSYKCIGSNGDNIYQCMSSKNINGRKKNKGVWDRPCLFNKECPFYKANKNYDNEMGGCVNGQCQMPLGVTNVGYHFYTDLDMSICYNCIDSEHCCLDQLDRKKYSKLKSPDYAFKNDNRQSQGGKNIIM